MEKSAFKTFRHIDEDAALRTLLEGTATEIGEGFFAALVKNLAYALSTHAAWVTEYLETERQLRPFSTWYDGQWIDYGAYDVTGTPCEPVVADKHLVHIPDKTIELYPGVPMFRQAGALSYLGVPLLDLQGNVLGHLAVLDARPMPEEPQSMALFKIFAARAAAELQRLRAESALRKKNEHLEQLVEELNATQVQLIQSGKMASLGKLTAGVAHEMNTPIGAIKSTADVTVRCIDKLEQLGACEADPERREEWRKVFSILKNNSEVFSTAGDRIAKILNSLENFTGLDEAEVQQVDLHTGIESTLTLLKSEFDDSIDLVKEFGQLPPVTCYPGQLNQVFMQLLSNALQALNGQGTLTIRTFLDKGMVHVQVADTGVGIEPERIPRLFDPEFSATDARVKVSLGLATCYTIVQKHQGSIEIQSQVGEGSSFTVVLPTDLKIQTSAAAGPA